MPEVAQLAAGDGTIGVRAQAAWLQHPEPCAGPPPSRFLGRAGMVPSGARVAVPIQEGRLEQGSPACRQAVLGGCWWGPETELSWWGEHLGAPPQRRPGRKELTSTTPRPADCDP